MVLARNKQVGIAGRKSSCYCYCLNSYDMTVSNELRLIKPRSKIFGPFRMEHSSFKLPYSSSTAGNWSLFPFKREPSHSGLLCINWTFLTVIMSTISQLDTRLHAERNVTGMGKEGRAMPSIDKVGLLTLCRHGALHVWLHCSIPAVLIRLFLLEEITNGVTLWGGFFATLNSWQS